MRGVLSAFLMTMGVAAEEVVDMVEAEQGKREALAAQKLKTHTVEGDGKSIELKKVDIVTPHGVALATGCSVTVKRGSSLMVTGRNATGKVRSAPVGGSSAWQSNVAC